MEDWLYPILSKHILRNDLHTVTTMCENVCVRTVIGREQESGCYIKVIGLRGILFSLCFFFSAAMLFLTVVFQGKRTKCLGRLLSGIFPFDSFLSSAHSDRPNHAHRSTLVCTHTHTYTHILIHTHMHFLATLVSPGPGVYSAGSRNQNPSHLPSHPARADFSGLNWTVSYWAWPRSSQNNENAGCPCQELPLLSLLFFQKLLPNSASLPT